MVGAFIVCAKKVGYPWTIDSWKEDRAEAERIAGQLTVKPYMATKAAVFEVSGEDALPTFTLTFTATGND